MGYLKARSFGASSAAAAVAIALVLVARNAKLDVILHREPLQVRLVLLAPAALAVSIVPTLIRPFGEVETRHQRRLLGLRLAHLVWVALLPAVLALLLVLVQPSAGLAGPVIRNAALLVGLTLVGAPWLRESSWLPPLLFAVLCYVRGTQYYGGRIRPWALLLRDLDSTSLIVTGATCVLGAAALLLHTDPRLTRLLRIPE